MAFHEVQFPVDISYSSKGGPGYNTNIVVADSGNEERISRWASAKRQYNIRYGIKSREQMQAVHNFYILRGGAVYGFRYKDWLDFNSTSQGHQWPPDQPTNTTPLDQILGTADGTTTAFQLVKVYSDTVTTKTRNIVKPVNGTVQVAVGGTAITTGWAVDLTTGVVLFGSAPTGAGNVTAGFEFDTPVRFSKNCDDVLMASIDDFGYGSLDPIELVEVPDGLMVNEDVNTGGAAQLCLKSDYMLAPGIATAYILEPQSSGLSVILPDPTSLPVGGPMFILANLGPTSVNIKLNDGVTVLATLAAAKGCEIILALSGGGTKTWYVI